MIETVQKIKDCVQSENTDQPLYLAMNKQHEIFTTLRKTKYSPTLVRVQIEKGFASPWDVAIKQLPGEVYDWIHWLMRTE
jgi:hypothetical protein